ncbi:uncharacterized protein YjbI with pentapeptide repeats [Gelidibacter sediminis]|uniref:Uncharacterized protein YjbI with pentapeptide repeats n=1 Tax=Gelidibacter sediminis TaxID=1608710 RepID=A0A4R7PZY2_9FLAO|nr:pentapeptide repeat-containing protein [Gelidibacter sediminis]TDU40588.1 uncharacterized protein YjbI with pentapeptide repeats [Gelidibacter sediminis]
MTPTLIESTEFNNMNFSDMALQKAEYDYCTFTNCNFTGSDLSSITFIECVFDTCNLSNANIKNTIFRDAEFIDCKLTGVQFQDCNSFLLSFSFNNCHMQFASFYRLKLNETKFVNCNLNHSNFTETNLMASVFESCDFKHAIFDHTNLSKADLSTSENFILNPQHNNVKHTKFSKENVFGLLQHYQIDII